MSKKTKAIGVDIGGSHISCAAFETETKQVFQVHFCGKRSEQPCRSPRVILDIWE